MSEERKPNIGPQDLAAVKDSPLLLSQKEWFAIQRYVASVLELPDTEQKMRSSLAKEQNKERIPYIGPFDEFKELLAGYQKVIPHVRVWDDDIFPKTVELAQHISNYANKAKVWYGKLYEAIDDLLQDPDDEEVKKRFAALCTNLSNVAAGNEKSALEVYKAIERFAKDTSDDEVLLKDLGRTYDGKFGKHSAAMKAWAKEMDDLSKEIEQLNKDYEYDCLVAETTPTYAWILLWVAAIVAGIYGARAAELKRKIDEKKERVEKLQDDTRRAILLTSTLTIAIKGLGDIQEQIKAALPCIQKIQGVWKAIGSDLKQIGKIIKEDIVQEELLKDLGVELAIEQWQQCKQKADAYQAYAFIKVKKEEKAA